ncbi:hypothetical protein BDV96DRAFT_647153 [Lophiotrema nucula]|uniref:Uncharacterized protein n=1 Tax=Lophiotrema nucula TaxID=690887 RepID=A0A6A5Z4P1_9PLEO|nr:hypothetical protein BDV96DRAFT_647153 [Lophiotrema nucula]
MEFRTGLLGTPPLQTFTIGRYLTLSKLIDNMTTTNPSMFMQLPLEFQAPIDFYKWPCATPTFWKATPDICLVSKYFFQAATPIFIKSAKFEIRSTATNQSFIRLLEDIKHLTFSYLLNCSGAPEMPNPHLELMARCPTLRTVQLGMDLGSLIVKRDRYLGRHNGCSRGGYDRTKYAVRSVQDLISTYHLSKILECASLEHIAIDCTGYQSSDNRA